MKYVPSRLFIACMVPLLLVGGTGAWAWQKASSASLEDRAKLSFYELILPGPEGFRGFDQQASAESKLAANRLVARFMEEYPALDRSHRSVPDDENGFLQLYLLGGPPHHTGPVISDELSDILNGQAPWNSEKALEELENHFELVGRIERIGAMTDSSSARMPPEYVGFVSARAGKHSAEILLMKARLAAEAKDEAAALYCVRAAFRIADHYRGPDGGTLLCETIAILIDLGARDMIFKNVLPALGPDADLSVWKRAMPGPAYTPAAFSKILRNEWETSARFYLFPYVLNTEDVSALRDGKALARAFTEEFSSRVIETKGMDMKNFLRMDGEWSSERFADLTEESREIAEIFLVGSKAWSRGYVRAATIVRQSETAMDLLVLEQSGVVLDAASADSLAPDPLTGRPFVFDPSNRTLSVAETVSEVEPFKLPW